jgi:hypothetical protein
MHPDVKANAGPLFNYLFGAINKFEFRRQIGKDLAKKVWGLASNDGYLLMNCKLYAYAASRGPASPKAFDIDRSDVALLKKIDLSHLGSKYQALSLSEYQSLEARVTGSRELSVYIGKFISKKLIFLTRSYGVTREEIHSLLLFSAIFAMRLKYPKFETELHALNICKTTIHNTGIGLIEYWTRDKRQALISEGGGFQAVHVSLEHINTLSVMPEHADESKQAVEVLRSVKKGLPVKERRLLSLASGEHDTGFSLYLGADNSDLAEEWPFPRYIAQVYSYLRIDPADGQTLLASLRTHFQ